MRDKSISTHKQQNEQRCNRRIIKSIIERLSFNKDMSEIIVGVMIELKKETPKQKFDLTISDDDEMKKYLDNIVARYESIYFDLQRNIDVKKEDFERLFPKVETKFDTYNSIVPNLNCLNMQMVDMKAYCLRLV